MPLPSSHTTGRTDPVVTCLDVLTGLQCRLTRIPSRPEPVAGLREPRFEHGAQHLMQCLLDEPVQHRGYPQLALAASLALSGGYCPPRGGHPCRPANRSPCRVDSGLSPPSHPTATTRIGTAPVKALRAMPGAPIKRPPKRPLKSAGTAAHHFDAAAPSLSCSITWSREKLAAFCRGGYFLKVSRNWPT